MWILGTNHLTSEERHKGQERMDIHDIEDDLAESEWDRLAKKLLRPGESLLDSYGYVQKDFGVKMSQRLVKKAEISRIGSEKEAVWEL